ncbi:MAG: hypothetical protein HC902_03000 [Calothrix sp. SM1_5_4]|nr:hypothetical protein [Calothrix sp. SM1_5_4]
MFKRPKEPIIDDRNLGKKSEKIPDRIYLSAWVQEDPLEAIGNFLENDNEATLPVVNQYVYVKLKKGLGHVGQKLLIAKDAGKIRTVNSEFENEVPAYLVQVSGELELTEAVESQFSRSRDKREYDAFRGLITKTTGLSLRDFALIDGELSLVDLSAKGPRGTTTALVIGSERHPASMLFGEGDIIFLNKGNRDGVAVGQILDVFGNRRFRHPNTPVEFSPAPTGTVKVVKVTPGFATAVVLNARGSILQGG